MDIQTNSQRLDRQVGNQYERFQKKYWRIELYGPDDDENEDPSYEFKFDINDGREFLSIGYLSKFDVI